MYLNAFAQVAYFKSPLKARKVKRLIKKIRSIAKFSLLDSFFWRKVTATAKIYRQADAFREQKSLLRLDFEEMRFPSDKDRAHGNCRTGRGSGGFRL